MSSVNPPDGGYQYYQRTLNDLEKDLKDDHARAERRRERDVQHLEEGYRNDVQRRDEKTVETINKIKDNSADQVSRERESARAEVNRVKAETYDKYGRYHGLEGDVLQSQLESLKRDFDQREKDHAQEMDLAGKNYDHRVSELQADHAQDLERVAKDARDAAEETYHRTYEGKTRETNEFKAQAEKRYEMLNRARLDDMEFQRRRSDGAIGDVRRDFSNRLDTAKRGFNSKAAELDTSYEERLDDSTRRLNESHQAEMRTLREQVHELSSDQDRYVKEKGQGTADAIKEKESEYREQRRLVEDGFEKQVKKLKEQADSTETYKNRQNARNLREKERHYAELLNKQNLEHNEQTAELQSAHARDREQLEMQIKRNEIKTRDDADRRIDQALAERDRILENQSKAFAETMGRQRAADEDKIKLLEKEVHTRNTTARASDISPAAEEAVRKSANAEWNKTFQAEHQRNQDSQESIVNHYKDLLQTTIDDDGARFRNEKANTMADRHSERSRLLDHIQDTEFQKQLALRNQDYESTKTMDNFHREYSQILEKQRREYEDHMQASKNDAIAKITAVRQEADFASRMSHRAFAAQQNELIREYDKKLAEQKVYYENLLQDVKGQSQKVVQEAERKNRQDMEEQARSYDQRMAAAEFTHKERERYLTENFQDQLEKARRSNALLVSKKS